MIPARRVPGWPFGRPGRALALLVATGLTALGATTLAACGSGGGSASGTPPTSTSSSRTGPSGRAVAVDEAADGTTVALGRGARLTVTLHSTYWQLGPPSDTGVLTVTAAPEPRADPSCGSIPGTGCGSVTAAYLASATGTATLNAHRDSCGEALRCSPAQGNWSIRVHVSG